MMASVSSVFLNVIPIVGAIATALTMRVSRLRLDSRLLLPCEARLWTRCRISVFEREGLVFAGWYFLVMMSCCWKLAPIWEPSFEACWRRLSCWDSSFASVAACGFGPPGRFFNGPLTKASISLFSSSLRLLSCSITFWTLSCSELPPARSISISVLVASVCNPSYSLVSWLLAAMRTSCVVSVPRLSVVSYGS